MLLLSLSLHVALVMIIVPRTYTPAPDVSVISARLLERPSDIPEAPVEPHTEPVLEPVVSAAVPEQDTVKPPVLPVPDTPPVPAVEPVSVEPPVKPLEAPKAESPVPQVAQVELDRTPVPVEPRADSPVSRAMPPDAVSPSIPVLVDTHWYEARQLDAQPRAVTAIRPDYPPEARRRGIEGMVKLRLRIDEYGVVQEAEVEAAEPPGLFDESALAAFRQGKFHAARRDNRPVRAQIYIRVRYEQDD